MFELAAPVFRNQSRGFSGLSLKGPEDHFRVPKEVKLKLAFDDAAREEQMFSQDENEAGLPLHA